MKIENSRKATPSNMWNFLLLFLIPSSKNKSKTQTFLRRSNGACDMKMKNSLEGIVIKWASQVDEVMKESSMSLFEKNNNPTPMAELKFWDNRRKNIMNIYDQLRDPRVKKVGSILEIINSVYFNTFSNTFKSIVTALHEANDITLYLKPLVSCVFHFCSMLLSLRFFFLSEFTF